MILEVIDRLNIGFKSLFEKYPDAKFYGLTQPIARIDGDRTEVFPGVITPNGEIQYVGIDDIYSAILYHKNISISSTLNRRSGFGDSMGNWTTVFNNSLIIYVNRKRICAMPDDLIFFIQSNFPDEIKIEPFKKIDILFQSVILNTAQVYENEYQDVQEKVLDPSKSMMAINYSIEATFSKNCFSECIF